MMVYTDNDLYGLYAASDLYIKSHANQGVCDEFATMDVSSTGRFRDPFTVPWHNVGE